MLALVAGSHGTEYASIIALEQTDRTARPGADLGNGDPGPADQQPRSSRRSSHVNPVDGKSMNRFYPGQGGRHADRARVIPDHEAGGGAMRPPDRPARRGLDESLRPYSYWTKTGNEKQDADLARDGPGVRARQHNHLDGPAEGSAGFALLENTATTRGKPSITAEAGHAGTVEPEDVTALVRWLPERDAISQDAAGRARDGRTSGLDRVDQASVTSEQTGIFYPLVKRGTYVDKGTRLGYVTDYFGRKIFEARAPEAGVVLYICAVPSMTKGGTIANIGVVASFAAHDAGRGNEARSLRDRVAARRGRDGGGLQGAGHAARADGRGQGAAAADMSASPEVRQRFEREAKTISQLSHPHICALYDVGREGEIEYLVMEYLEGETLLGPAGEGSAAARADAALRRGDRRRAGQGAPAGDRAPGPQARQRDDHEVGRQGSRLRPGARRCAGRGQGAA